MLVCTYRDQVTGRERLEVTIIRLTVSLRLSFEAIKSTGMFHILVAVFVSRKE